ncbi:predicted protein [Nematostella vectensis]|uniref:G-protein coupled receptors family 1 profile domain-containing protein n=1 Tax=Nematostella vectensis TaxID=45351 RepID=A7SF75_NEMVE|nr:histamine H2 receptor [Nematostella vectensis]XP_032233971.1 histamine H2 receptor [Nematostella vectensis]XP_032233972.1 histamine H2 receptor [Nematostella vectensis]XP_032233973.1 histamine H2 receptor [Nematostella vectensis]EDO37637.1 predicted protein [Nematostella vectensis]|eukprot:XP_001629700.1 predicted protein [Nematostella vectensis]
MEAFDNITKIMKNSSGNSTGIGGFGDHPPIDMTLNLLIMGFLVAEGTIVIGINAFVIFLIFYKRFLQTTTNMILGSLATSDMLTGLVVIPLIVACNMLPTYNFGVCLAMDLGQRFLAISTILHLLVVTLERYHYIVVSRIVYAPKASRASAAGVFVFLWGFSLLVSFIQLVWTHEDESTKTKFDRTYDVVCLGALVLLPLLIMTIAYVKIFVALKRQLDKIKRHVGHISSKCNDRHNRKERKAILIYTLMIIVYVVGWFNYFFHTLRLDFGLTPTSLPLGVELLFVYLKFSTGLLNPILYSFLKQDFKRARKSLGCCGGKRPRLLNVGSKSVSNSTNSTLRELISLRSPPAADV